LCDATFCRSTLASGAGGLSSNPGWCEFVRIVRIICSQKDHLNQS